MTAHPRAAVLAALLLAGCGASPRETAPSSPPPARPQPQAQAPRPVPPPPPQPPQPPQPANFVLQGALTQGGFAVGLAPAGSVAVTLDGKPVGLAPDGRFAVGFGRDAPPRAVVEARTADGRRFRQELTVAARVYRIERIDRLPGKTQFDPEYERLRQQELARIRAARAVRAESGGWRQRFVWPATGRISGVYGSQRILGGVPRDPHYGVDIARPTGTPIVAPADGVVVLASPPRFSLEGNLLIIDHGMGMNSAFLHLSRIDVREGQRVTRGQTVGAIGATGRATGPHLHWGVNWGDVRLDPALLAGLMGG